MMSRIQLTVVLIVLTSHGGHGSSSSMENDGMGSFDSVEFGHRISSSKSNVSRSFDVLKGRDKRLVTSFSHGSSSDPMEHMLSMFHSALQLAQIEEILNQAVEFDEKPFVRRPTFNPGRLNTKTPPTPTERIHVSQKRILTGRRNPSPGFRSSIGSPFSNTPKSTTLPSVRTLPPKQIRFLQHSTTVRPSITSTPLPVKRLPSFKPQNIPTRQRIRIKIPQVTTTSLPETPSSPPFSLQKLRFASPTPIVSSLSTTPIPHIKKTAPHKNNNFIQSHGLTSKPLKKSPLQFQKFKKTKSSIRLPPKSAIKSLPPHIRKSTPSPSPLENVKPFKPSPKIVEGNFVPSTQAWARKSRPASKESNAIDSRRRFPVSSRLVTKEPNAIDSRRRPPISSRPVTNEFNAADSRRRPPVSSRRPVIKDFNAVDSRRRPPVSSRRPVIKDFNAVDSRRRPPVSSRRPVIKEFNAIDSRQRPPVSSSRPVTKEPNAIDTRRRPPVVPRVPIIPRNEENNFIKSNVVSNKGPGFRKGKNINEDSQISSNQELLLLSSTSTNFQCANQEYPGLYADIETNCQTFHMCQVGGRQNTFICPVGTMFDQRYLVCNWSSRVNCGKSTDYYEINRKIYEPSA